MAARSDLAGGAGWMVFGLVILVAAWRMDRFEAMGATAYTAPGLVPGLFGVALLLLGAALAWRGWRARSASVEPGEPLLNRRIALTLLLTLGYAVAMVGRLPFTLGTALFVGVFCALFTDTGSLPRRLGVAALAGVLTAVVIVFVFERIFLVRLP